MSAPVEVRVGLHPVGQQSTVTVRASVEREAIAGDGQAPYPLTESNKLVYLRKGMLVWGVPIEEDGHGAFMHTLPLVTPEFRGLHTPSVDLVDTPDAKKEALANELTVLGVSLHDIDPNEYGAPRDIAVMTSGTHYVLCYSPKTIRAGESFGWDLPETTFIPGGGMTSAWTPVGIQSDGAMLPVVKPMRVLREQMLTHKGVHAHLEKNMFPPPGSGRREALEGEIKTGLGAVATLLDAGVIRFTGRDAATQLKSNTTGQATDADRDQLVQLAAKFGILLQQRSPPDDEATLSFARSLHGCNGSILQRFKKANRHSDAGSAFAAFAKGPESTFDAAYLAFCAWRRRFVGRAVTTVEAGSRSAVNACIGIS